MNLTPDYKLVTAVFDTELSREEKIGFVEGTPSETTRRIFTVGDFTYEVAITEKDRYDEPGTYGVEFRLKRINQDGQQLIETMQKIFKRENLDLEDARELRQTIAYSSRSWDVLGIGNAFRVMGSVLQIVKSFVNAYPDAVKCLVFTSSEESRTDLYRSILHRFFSAYYISEERDPYMIDPKMVAFMVCRD